MRFTFAEGVAVNVCEAGFFAANDGFCCSWRSLAVLSCLPRRPITSCAGRTCMDAILSVMSNKSASALNWLGASPRILRTASTNLVNSVLSRPVELYLSGVFTDLRNLTKYGLDVP